MSLAEQLALGACEPDIHHMYACMIWLLIFWLLILLVGIVEGIVYIVHELVDYAIMHKIDERYTNDTIECIKYFSKYFSTIFSHIDAKRKTYFYDK